MNEKQAGPRPSPALIAEATKRAGLIWLEVGERRARAVWHVWLRAAAVSGTPQPPASGAAYVLTGPGEQEVPGLPEAAAVRVIVPSRETGGALVTWSAAVGTVEPGGAEWQAVVGPLLAGRLNVAAEPDGASPAERWARDCELFRLQPAAAE